METRYLKLYNKHHSAVKRLRELENMQQKQAQLLSIERSNVSVCGSVGVSVCVCVGVGVSCETNLCVWGGGGGGGGGGGYTKV